MIDGLYQLCGELRPLEDSHVWPKFAYKRNATDPGGGGRFVDFHEQAIRRETGAQQVDPAQGPLRELSIFRMAPGNVESQVGGAWGDRHR